MTIASTAHAELDREQVDRIVEKARISLIDHHKTASTPRFPFGFHHAHVRRNLRVPKTRRFLEQTEISNYLAEWAVEHGGAVPYAWQSIMLATKEITGPKGSAAADKVLKEAEKALKGSTPFLAWMKNKLAEAA